MSECLCTEGYLEGMCKLGIGGSLEDGERCERRHVWPIPMAERARLALSHEPKASSSPDGFRLATCVVCERPMVAMWHLWLDAEGLKKEIHMCHKCATDIYGAPVPSGAESDFNNPSTAWEFE